MSIKPTRGVELQYGSLDFRHGEATELTAYDYDGYVTGQRITLSCPDQIYFDEISYTAGFLSGFNTPNVNKRYHHLRQVNFITPLSANGSVNECARRQITLLKQA